MANLSEIDKYLCEQLFSDLTAMHHSGAIQTEKEENHQQQQQQPQQSQLSEQQQQEQQNQTTDKNQSSSSNKKNNKRRRSQKSKKVDPRKNDVQRPETITITCSGGTSNPCINNKKVARKRQKRHVVVDEPQKKEESESDKSSEPEKTSSNQMSFDRNKIAALIKKNKSLRNSTLSGPNAGRILYITFDGYIESSGKHIHPKKCSVFDVVNGGVSTFFIKPTCAWQYLPSETRNKYNFIERYVLGYPWNSGQIDYDVFIEYLLNLSHETRAIFAETVRWRNYLSDILGRTVYHVCQVKNQVYVKPSQVNKNYSDITCLYTDHKRKCFAPGYENLRYDCCQARVFKDGQILVNFFAKDTENKIVGIANQVPYPDDINRPATM